MQVMTNSTIQHQAWRESVLRLISNYSAGTVFTSDRLRATVARRNLGRPHHPNAWGNVVNQASLDGLIKKTGRYVPSVIASNHKAVVAEWRRL